MKGGSKLVVTEAVESISQPLCEYTLHCGYTKVESIGDGVIKNVKKQELSAAAVARQGATTYDMRNITSNNLSRKVYITYIIKH